MQLILRSIYNSGKQTWHIELMASLQENNDIILHQNLFDIIDMSICFSISIAQHGEIIIIINSSPWSQKLSLRVRVLKSHCSYCSWPIASIDFWSCFGDTLYHLSENDIMALGRFTWPSYSLENSMNLIRSLSSIFLSKSLSNPSLELGTTKYDFAMLSSSMSHPSDVNWHNLTDWLTRVMGQFCHDHKIKNWLWC